MTELKTDAHLLQTTVTGSSGLFITNEDNMLLMSRYPDNYFDLAIERITNHTNQTKLF